LRVSQVLPFDNGEYHSPHEGGPEFLKKPVTKEQKVPSVFDLDRACGCNSLQCGGFKELGAELGGHSKSCLKISRYRKRGDLPWATGGGTVESSASSVFGLRECVLVAASHGVET
jgi:hypothetical protein